MISMKWPAIATLMAAGTMGTTAILTRPLQSPEPSIAVVIPKPVIVAPAIRTVTWFVAHGDERTTKLLACNDNPGVAMHDPECPNASQAVSEISYQRDVAELHAMGIPVPGDRQ